MSYVDTIVTTDNLGRKPPKELPMAIVFARKSRITEEEMQRMLMPYSEDKRKEHSFVTGEGPHSIFVILHGDLVFYGF